MLKNLSTTTKLFAALISIVLFIMIIVISISGNKVEEKAQVQYASNNASADNKVEALRTMTANLLSVESKNKELQKSIKNLQTQNKETIGELKNSMEFKIQEVLEKIRIQDRQNNQKQKIKKKDYPVNGSATLNSFIWISDLSKINTKNPIKTTGISSGIEGNNGATSLLHFGNNKSQRTTTNTTKRDPIKPAYTIPVNATLTGATLMTPLVGRIPIDGKLPSPYNFKLILSAKNLTANGYPMPGVKGAVMSGIARGDMLGRCARGDIKSITFIFADGRISTTQSKGNNNSLGYLSSQTGNPCIAGVFHSNAAIFLGAQMGLSAAQGYANAISSSQYLRSTTAEGRGIQALVGSANKVAIGQSASAAAKAAQTWWNRRVQNSFDYIYVSNVDPKTKRSMKVVVNISEEIRINYNSNARKVHYEKPLQALNRQLD